MTIRIVLPRPLRALAFGLLAVALFAGGALAAAAFNDVGDDHPASAEITAAHSIGVFNGYGDGTFRPDGKLTQGQAENVIWRILTWQGTDDDGNFEISRADAAVLAMTGLCGLAYDRIPDCAAVAAAGERAAYDRGYDAGFAAAEGDGTRNGGSPEPDYASGECPRLTGVPEVLPVGTVIVLDVLSFYINLWLHCEYRPSTRNLAEAARNACQDTPAPNGASPAPGRLSTNASGREYVVTCRWRAPTRDLTGEPNVQCPNPTSASTGTDPRAAWVIDGWRTAYDPEACEWVGSGLGQQQCIGSNIANYFQNVPSSHGCPGGPAIYEAWRFWDEMGTWRLIQIGADEGGGG